MGNGSSVSSSPVVAPPGSGDVAVGGTPAMRHKGIAFDSEGRMLSCLFCRIAAGDEDNALWYRDDHVAVFVPRKPAAMLHLLVIPTAHVGDISSLTSAHSSLLQHMENVALQQLGAHAPHFDLASRALGRKAPPPSHHFPRGHLPPVTASHTNGDSGSATYTPPPAIAAVSSGVSSDAGALPDLQRHRVRLLFHRPPFNSIHHLHLHALYTPYVSFADSFHFLGGSPWVATLEEAKRAAAGRPCSSSSSHPEA